MITDRFTIENGDMPDPVNPIDVAIARLMRPAAVVAVPLAKVF